MPLDCDWPTPEETVQQQENDEDALDLNAIRKAAKENGYEEWFYCERYQVIQTAAFQKTQADGDVVKIQVYPKTHAVSVCYFHHDDDDDDEEETNESTTHTSTDERLKELLSTNKKSLYAAQGIDTVEKVSEILTDPLEYGTNITYTRRDNLKDPWCPPVDPLVKEFCAFCNKPPAQDKSLLVCSICKSVAYCDRNCQRGSWKRHKKECYDCCELDIARRFYHVAIVTGLTTNPGELAEIVGICQLFDSLLFEPDGPPCMCRARHGCGSVCALSSMLLEIGRQHHDVIGITSTNYAMQRFFGQVEKQENYQASFHPCEYHDDFMEHFEPYMGQLENDIVSLKPNIRSELLQWLFERIRCNEKLIMIDTNEMPLVKPKTTFPIHFANMDYSRMLFGDDAEQAICFTHGTFHRSSYEDEEEGNDDVSDAGTERTTNESDDEDDDEEDEEHEDDIE